MPKGMKFNNIRKPNIYLLEGRVKAPFSPLRRDIVRTPNGYRLKKTVREPLQILQPIGYVVEGDEHALNIKDELAKWLITDNLAPLEFDDEPGRTYWVLVQNTIEDFERFAYLRRGTIKFISFYATGKEHTIDITTTPQSFNVNGQTPTPYTTKTIFSESANRFTLEGSNGLKIILNFNFTAGDVLEIDSKERDVFLNGIDLATAVSLETDWAKGELPVGSIELVASHDTELTYDERFY